MGSVALRLRARLGSAARDSRGIAVVEFALVLPFMLLLYVSASAITLAVSADRASVVLARTLADLTSQQQANVNLTDTSAQNIFLASSFVMAPFSTTTLQMTLSNVEFVTNAASTGSNGLDAKTRWTVTFSGGTLRPCTNPLLTPVSNGSTPSATTMPMGLYQNAGFLIVADVKYVYTPSFGYLSFGTSGTGGRAGQVTSSSAFSFTMLHTDYMRPRQTNNIRYTSGQSASICPIVAPQTT